jgi:hypothetical protein
MDVLLAGEQATPSVPELLAGVDAFFGQQGKASGREPSVAGYTSLN